MSKPPVYQNIGTSTKAILEILGKYRIPDLDIDNLIKIITNDIKTFTYIDIDDDIKREGEGKGYITDIMKSLVSTSKEPLTYRRFEDMLKYIKEIFEERYIVSETTSDEFHIDYDLLMKDVENDSFWNDNRINCYTWRDMAGLFLSP